MGEKRYKGRGGMKIYELSKLRKEELKRLKRRSEFGIVHLIEEVQPIIKEVKEEGDKALRKYNEKFDNARVKNLKVEEEEISKAYEKVSEDVVEALKASYSNIKKFHEWQKSKGLELELRFTEIAPGIIAGEKLTPIESVGLYVPRGKGAFPSVMLMLGIPATIAGVKKIIVCTPPKKDGSIDPASLVAADLCAIRDIFKVGGAQAIAAMAYGTETIPKVSKIIGPGSGYVATAKRILYGYGIVDVGVPAGPSEAIILADADANPKIVAHDLLIEAEHGFDSSSLLVTESKDLVSAVSSIIPKLIEELPLERRKFCEYAFSNSGSGGVIIAKNFEEAISFVNEYAPEHVELLVKNPFDTLSRIENAGEILLGHFTPISSSNYALGTNAILPTGGFAKSSSATSVFDFLKRSYVASLTEEGFKRMIKNVKTLAEYESFAAHGMVIKGREERGI